MTSEQIVRQTLAALDAHDVIQAAAYASEAVTDPKLNLRHSLNKQVFFAQMEGILQAFPDWKYALHAITTQNNQVTVDAIATHTRPLKVGSATVPPTGKRVVVPDEFIFTVKDGLVTAITIHSPTNGGAAEMLRQLGIG